MTAKWDTKEELSEITKELELCKKINNSGNVSFEGFTFQKNKIEKRDWGSGFTSSQNVKRK